MLTGIQRNIYTDVTIVSPATVIGNTVTSKPNQETVFSTRSNSDLHLSFTILIIHMLSLTMATMLFIPSRFQREGFLCQAIERNVTHFKGITTVYILISCAVQSLINMIFVLEPPLSQHA